MEIVDRLVMWDKLTMVAVLMVDNGQKPHQMIQICEFYAREIICCVCDHQCKTKCLFLQEPSGPTPCFLLRQASKVMGQRFREKLPLNQCSKIGTKDMLSKTSKQERKDIFERSKAMVFWRRRGGLLEPYCLHKSEKLQKACKGKKVISSLESQICQDCLPLESIT